MIIGSVWRRSERAAPSSLNSISSNTTWLITRWEFILHTYIISVHETSESQRMQNNCVLASAYFEDHRYTCSYKSISFLSGSFRFWVTLRTMSQCPLLMSLAKLSTLSTVLRETPVSSWSVCRLRRRLDSFRNCWMRRMMLKYNVVLLMF